MNATIIRFDDGGFESVVTETYPSGFTNHRVSVRPAPNGWTVEDSRKQSKPEIVPDLQAVRAWLVIESCLACPFLSAAAKGARAFLASPA